MTVRCLGECRLLEQVGEKQDFECTLTARGIRHEEFVLRVRRLADRDPAAVWNCDYSVTVIRAAAGVRHSYRGGPRYRWVERFAADLAKDVYEGGPSPAGVAAIANRHARNGSLPFEGSPE